MELNVLLQKICNKLSLHIFHVKNKLHANFPHCIFRLAAVGKSFVPNILLWPVVAGLSEPELSFKVGLYCLYKKGQLDLQHRENWKISPQQQYNVSAESSDSSAKLFLLESAYTASIQTALLSEWPIPF